MGYVCEESEIYQIQALCEGIGAKFIPLVVESLGGLGEQLITFLPDLRVIAQQNLSLTDGVVIN